MKLPQLRTTEAGAGELWHRSRHLMKPGPVVQTLEAQAKRYFILPKNEDILYPSQYKFQSEGIEHQYNSITQSTIYTQIPTTVPVMSFMAVSSPIQILIQDSAFYFPNSLVSFNLE